MREPPDIPLESSNEQGQMWINKPTALGNSSRVVDARFFDVEHHDKRNYTPNPHYERGDRGQGRLFAEQEYVRGYSPNRQRRINEAMESKGPLDRSRQWNEDIKEWEKPKVGTRGPVPVDTSGMLGLGQARIPARSTEGKQRRALVQESYKRELVEQLKRSTIPPEHLTSAAFQIDPTGGYRGGEYSGHTIRMQGDVRVVQTPRTPQEMEAEHARLLNVRANKAELHGEGFVIPESQVKASKLKNEKRPYLHTGTLIHEMGHHVDLSVTREHGLSSTGGARMRPYEAEVREKAIRKSAKDWMPRSIKDKAMTSNAERKAWTEQHVIDESRRLSGGQMYTTTIGLNEGAADVYTKLHTPGWPEKRPSHAYTPKGIEQNVRNTGPAYGTASMAQGIELARRAYEVQHERFGMETTKPWQERNQRGTTEPEHEQGSLF